MVHARIWLLPHIMSTPESTLTLCRSRLYPLARDFGFCLCSQDCRGQKYSCRCKPHGQDLHSVTPKTLDMGVLPPSLGLWLSDFTRVHKKVQSTVHITPPPPQTSSLPSICRHQRGTERELQLGLFKTPAAGMCPQRSPHQNLSDFLGEKKSCT